MRSTMTYGDILAANLRAARAVARLHQARLSADASADYERDGG